MSADALVEVRPVAARLCLWTHAGAMGMWGSTGRPPRKLEGHALPGRDASVPRSSERSICRRRGQIEPDSDGAAPTSTTIARAERPPGATRSGMVPLCLLLRDSPTSRLLESIIG
jgi:hypothetical protein